ncbi:hypothetical protein DCAR_0100560 [Daucus carota subsp. sativus]|uniref:Uncharacterized protein n=1 Tax=Daucus carota subsp. sativus TaxID=79200 RepID=A0A166FRL6_DAUCS|nr:hypothetical protein DCAR_0100560 [Daucus carota subsp. sativus]
MQSQPYSKAPETERERQEMICAGGSYGAGNAMQDEISKDHLKHVLEYRKSVLQKEEAMACINQEAPVWMEALGK